MFREIVLCQFPLTSGTPGKVRPALILFALSQDAIICRITSVLRSSPRDIPIHDWQSAGLLLPSVARIDRLVTTEKSIFLRRLGVSNSADSDTIRQAWNQFMRL